MEKFHKKYPGMAQWRQDQIDIIKEGNAPVLIFTHPMDAYEGLTSDWMDDVPNFKRVVVSENKKIKFVRKWLTNLKNNTTVNKILLDLQSL